MAFMFEPIHKMNPVDYEGLSVHTIRVLRFTNMLIF